MRSDARQRVRSAITDVMDEYGVNYEHIRKSNHPAIRFTVGDQTRTLTYSGGDPRAHMNARTQAKRLLQELGAMPVNPNADVDFDQPDLPHDDNILHVVEEESKVIADEPVSEPIPEQTPHEAEPVAAEAQPQEPPSPEPRMQPATHVDHKYVLFEPVKYNQPQYQVSTGRFISIKLSRELLVPEGHRLVIPLDVEDTVLDMTEQEFRAFFKLIEAERANQVADEPANVDAEPASPPPVQEAAPDVQTSVPEPEPHFPPPQPPHTQTERRRGVSPQLGRVLLAMNYLHQRGNLEMAGNAIQALLSPVDQKQVSGMLSGAIKQNFVARGSTLEGGRGSNYKLLAKGRRMADSLDTWPYDHRNLAVPDWLRTSLRRS